VSVTLSLLDRPVDLVEEGLDVAVRIGLLPESSAIASRVGAVRRIVVASADYLAQHGAPAAPADLARHAIVAFSGVAGVEQWAFRGTAREGNVAINPRLVVTTAEAALDAARAGFGITRVLSYQAAQDIARGSLLRLLPAHEGDELPIHLLYPSGRHLAPKLRAFVDFASPRLRRRCEAITRAIHS
jgi:DNA-binding transcriptional LysR family regulator